MDAETNKLPLLTRLTHVQHYGYVPFSVRCDVVEAIDTITRLTAERDEARAECERLRAINIWNREKERGASDDAAIDAIRAAKEPK